MTREDTVWIDAALDERQGWVTQRDENREMRHQSSLGDYIQAVSAVDAIDGVLANRLQRQPKMEAPK